MCFAEPHRVGGRPADWFQGEQAMHFNLANLQLSGMTQIGSALRKMGGTAQSMEEVSQQIVRFLYERLIDTSTGMPACSLVRLYRTICYGDLDDDLRAFGDRLICDVPLTPDTRCLTLVATVGEKPEWNSRFQSAGHKTIPLPSEEVVQAIPMVSQLVAQLGLDVSSVVKPDSNLLLEAEQHVYNVFYVDEAKGSPYIPAQSDFVIPFNIRSVIGFGGLFPSGDVYAILMFTKVFVPRNTADMFRNIAMNVRVALLPLSDGPVFSRI